jgi:iron(III) transport system ATP-binding protein
LQNISKRYGESTAVADLSLDIERQEFFGLLGPSGCGKTTTLRMIAGLETPDTGRIAFNGRDITQFAPERRDFGMVFQNYALFPHLNVFENVAFGLRARKLAKAEIAERVRDALALVQLPGYERRAVSELSGGQQQRVAIARAIAIKPALLLFDEPLSNLDVALREETRSELRELVTKLGLTALYVTHDQEEAFALCDRISVMSEGRALQTGAPRELYERPTLIRVARFLGRNNLIVARRLTASDDALGKFKTIEGDHTLTVPVERGRLGPINKNSTLAIRPEHLIILNDASPEGEKATTENILRATIRELNFAGATTSVKLDAGGLMLEALLLGSDGLAPGDKCTVHLPANKIIMLGAKE